MPGIPGIVTVCTLGYLYLCQVLCFLVAMLIESFSCSHPRVLFLVVKSVRGFLVPIREYACCSLFLVSRIFFIFYFITYFLFAFFFEEICEFSLFLFFFFKKKL